MEVNVAAHPRMERELDKIKKEIERLSRALPQASDDPLLLVCLGASYEERFQLLGKRRDLNKAIKYASTALDLTPDDHPSLPGILADLAASFRRRFERSGKLGDLDKAIEYTSRAIGLTSQGHPDLPGELSRLGKLYFYRYRRSNEPGDLDQAIECGSHALALLPEGHQHLPNQLTNLGLLLHQRFNRLGDLDDLGKIIEYTSRAIDLTPENRQILQTQHSMLWLAYHARFRRMGELDDLNKAIKHTKRVVTLTPGNSPQLSTQLANLGELYRLLFRRSGEVDCLNEAIKYTSRACTSAPEGDSNLSPWLASLGTFHFDRYRRLDEPTDLDKAIEYRSRSLALLPTDHRQLPGLLATLGRSYAHRFQRLHELDDIEKAIEYGSRAVALTPDSHPELPTRHADLGAHHGHRFHRLSRLTDLDKAIEHTSCALNLTPDGHSDLPSRLASLGVFHGQRFQSLHEPNDLRKATEYNTRALALTDHNNPDSSSQLANPEISRMDQSESTLPSDAIASPKVGFQIQPLDGSSAEESSTTDNYEELVIQDIPISRQMSVDEVVAQLVTHGCQDLTNDVDHATFSEHPVSHGGLSDVYRGYLSNKIRVAIKIPRISASSIAENRKDFKHAARELHTWSKCTHPNILRLHGLAVFRDRIGMVSPWMQRGNLPQYLEQTPGVDRCGLCAQISDGLAYMHQIGIIHGDLKGVNVLISDDGTPVLTDFGNSLYPDQTMKFTETTSRNSLTVRWTAPEILNELSAPSEASDVYALAMTIYEVFAGTPPYSGKREQAIINLVVSKREPPERPQAIPTGQEYGEKIWNLLIRCWSYEPELRPEATSVARTMRIVIPDSSSDDIVEGTHDLRPSPEAT